MADQTEDGGFFTPPRNKQLADLNPATANTRPKRKGAKPTSRVAMVPQDFDNLIQDQGVYVRITPSALCPNRTDLTDTNHKLDCPLCNGDQLIDITSQVVETWAVIQGIKFNQENQVQGIYDIKDATITTQQNVKLYYWYKVEVLDFAAPFNQVLKRAPGTTDNLRYQVAPIGSVTLDEEQTTATLPTPDVPFVAIDSKGLQYLLNKDFKMKNNTIIWKNLAHSPAVGTLYTLIYAVLPTFRILDLQHEHRYYYVDFKRTEKTPVHLPQQAVMRWDYLAKGSGNQVTIPPAAP